MDLRQLRTFVTVAELGTVTRAAVQLNTAQPALSRQIAELEQQLGLRLFERVGRRLLLSVHGEELLGDCRRLLNDAKALGERAQGLQRGDIGILKVAASPHLIEGVFPRFLQVYSRHFPGVHVKLNDIVGTQEILGRLARGDLHLAQVVGRAFTGETPHLQVYPLAPTDMMAACQVGAGLGRSGRVQIEELASRPLLQITGDFAIRRLFDAACRVAGFEPEILLESRAPHALLALAEAGHGIAIIPCALRTHRYRLRIVRILRHDKPLREPLVMLTDSRRPLPPYGIAFCEMLARHVRNLFPITRPTTGARSRTSTKDEPSG
jgi:DNA-binding transcriptional LysR family regulator